MLYLFQASQVNDPKRTATATVTVIVDDINNNLPYFINKPYTANIDEHQSVGSFVIQMSAKDNDSVRLFNLLKYLLTHVISSCLNVYMHSSSKI